MMELVRPQSPAPGMSGHSDMVWIPGGTFRMGSDRHYAEEAPVHRVTVDGFWIDRTPVTNRQFRNFVRATGHVTYAVADGLFSGDESSDAIRVDGVALCRIC